MRAQKKGTRRSAIRHARRRNEILAAARVVFGRRGYEKATLDEIAERAEYAKGTVYNYFRSKEDLFQQTLNAFIDDVHGFAREVVAGRGDIRDRFRGFAVTMMQYYGTHEDLHRIVAMEMNRLQLEKKNPLRSLLKRVRIITETLGRALETEIAGGRVIAEDPSELATVFVALIHNRLMRRAFDTGGLQAMDPERDAEFLTRLFFDGIALP